MVNFQDKHLLTVCKTWHHFVTSKISLSSNISEVTKERVVLEYVTLDNIKFDTGKIIEEAIWANRGGLTNLGYPFLIFKLCEKVGVEFTWHKEHL